jgi:hypothetical protein
MRTAAIALTAVLLTAAATYSAEAVACGSLGELPLSGCITCEPATVNLTGRDGWHGWKGRRLSQDATAAHFGGGHGGSKPGNGGRWPPHMTETSMTLPNCTECDKDNFFVPMPPITSSKWAHPNLGRCGEWEVVLRPQEQQALQCAWQQPCRSAACWHARSSCKQHQYTAAMT